MHFLLQLITVNKILVSRCLSSTHLQHILMSWMASMVIWRLSWRYDTFNNSYYWNYKAL